MREHDGPVNTIRPDPDALLRTIGRQDGVRGRLKLFLGAAPGVGKTYEMLMQAARRRDAGEDVVIGVIETHGRAETEQRAAGFEIIPRRAIDHRGQSLHEMDLDAIIARCPALVLIDELAHTNAPGCRHDKRWQDVEEVLNAGIDVYSTLNVQHLESLNDVVASFARLRVRETLPDRVLDHAEIEVVDIPPGELIERLKAGKVYVPQEASRALAHFFSHSNLTALRELALRRAAQAVDAQMLDYLRAHALEGTWAAGERLLVAVGADAGAQEVVRAGKRLADSLSAPWTAVHIETGPASPNSALPNSGSREELAAALHLASQLGAQVATVPAAGLAEGLAHMAADLRATILVLGQGARRGLFRRDALSAQLAALGLGAALHIVPRAAPRRRTAPPRDAPFDPAAWLLPPGLLISGALIACVTLAGVMFAALGSVTNIALLYLLPVMLAATRYGLWTGIVTGLLSSLAYNFFFIPPVHTFTIADPQNLITVVVLLAVAVVVSHMAGRLRDTAMLSRASAVRSSALAGFARQLTGIGAAGDLGRVLCEEGAGLLGCYTVLLMPQDGALAQIAASPPDTALQALDRVVAQWAFDNRRPAGRGSDTLSAAEWLFLPVEAGGKALAVLGVAHPDAAQPVRADLLPMLTSFLDQAGLALDRIRLEAERGQMRRLEERDALRAALLSSVSHDLRTPLTAVIGLLGNVTPADPEQERVLALARAEGERLQRFVANLLDMVRIETGAVEWRPEPVDLAEAVSSAVHDLRYLLGARPLLIGIAPDLPLVRLDPRLLHHCLINLIENAAHYSPAETPIRIEARPDADGLDLAVIDAGPGLPPGAEARVFETFTRLEGSDRKGGTGLGLAIVKGFAEAMGLQARAANRTDGSGACFTLHMPGALLWKESDQP
ncbi:sensor histidine kinase KdpD [Novosphingobium sp. SG707]|uniref:sensor histidine kinase n=1 Tax=Novosphingobium sp. SG707 TaxID=2586996 RepID=UPI0014481EB5|nr:sensor histidine kinase KdpD [Novosphingobium sp. SG707]NKI98822.1 two-component system sensor histidine kinase KdpD [Novosphingobium sp. SG707]